MTAGRQLAAFWPTPDEDGDQLDLLEEAAAAEAAQDDDGDDG